MINETGFMLKPAKFESINIEECFLTLFENSGIGIGYFSPEGEAILVNKVAAECMDSQPEDIKGKTLLELYGEELGIICVNRIKKALQDNQNYSYEDQIDLTEGDSWYRSIYAPIYDNDGQACSIQISMVDISISKQAEFSYNQTQQKLIKANELVNIGWWDFDLQTEQSVWSPELCQIFGITIDKNPVKKEEFRNLIHPDWRAEEEERFQEILECGQIDYEHPIIRPDGVVRWIWNRAELQRDSRGSATNIVGISQDITKRKKTEKKLRESEKKYRSRIDNLMEGFYAVTLDGKLLDYNPKFSRILGLDPTQNHIGLSLPDFWQDPDDRNDYMDAINEQGHIVDYIMKAKKLNG
jgi:PAS domain S-box-containing protein